MKHTSVCLSDEMHATILRTGKPVNSVINAALENYFSGIAIDDNKLKEQIKDYLNSPTMRDFLRGEFRDAMLPVLSEYMPKSVQKDLANAIKKDIGYTRY